MITSLSVCCISPIKHNRLKLSVNGLGAGKEEGRGREEKKRGVDHVPVSWSAKIGGNGGQFGNSLNIADPGSLCVGQRIW